MQGLEDLAVGFSMMIVVFIIKEIRKAFLRRKSVGANNSKKGKSSYHFK